MLSFELRLSRCDLDLSWILLKFLSYTSSHPGEYLTQVSNKSFKGLRRYGADTKSQRTDRRTAGRTDGTT